MPRGMPDPTGPPAQLLPRAARGAHVSHELDKGRRVEENKGVIWTGRASEVRPRRTARSAPKGFRRRPDADCACAARPPACCARPERANNPSLRCRVAACALAPGEPGEAGQNRPDRAQSAGAAWSAMDRKAGRAVRRGACLLGAAPVG